MTCLPIVTLTQPQKWICSQLENNGTTRLQAFHGSVLQTCKKKRWSVNTRDDTRLYSSRMHTVCSSGRLLGGCLLWGGVCVCSGGVCSQGSVCSGGVCSQGVVSALGGCLLLGGGCLLQGGLLRGYPSIHWGRHPPCGQTYACKNITFATSLRTVKNTSLSFLVNPLRTTKSNLRVIGKHPTLNTSQYPSLSCTFLSVPFSLSKPSIIQ